MFERYIIVDKSLRNRTVDGAVVGFELDVRLAYYRGLALSMIEGFELSVDGEALSPASMIFHVAGEAFTFADLESEIEARWEFNETGTLFVAHPQGLAPGPHTIEIVEILRISYMPEPARRQDVKVLSIAA